MVFGFFSLVDGTHMHTLFFLSLFLNEIILFTLLPLLFLGVALHVQFLLSGNFYGWGKNVVKFLLSSSSKKNPLILSQVQLYEMN